MSSSIPGYYRCCIDCQGWAIPAESSELRCPRCKAKHTSAPTTGQHNVTNNEGKEGNPMKDQSKLTVEEARAALRKTLHEWRDAHDLDHVQLSPDIDALIAAARREAFEEMAQTLDTEARAEEEADDRHAAFCYTESAKVARALAAAGKP